MTLKYVGDLPRVSKKGVTFDHTQPDKYIYIHAAVELLEALSYGATETTQHLYNSKGKDIKASELLGLLEKYVKNMDALYKIRDEDAKKLVDKLVKRVEENDTLTVDERTAWLNNIKMMKDYYIQYITNLTAYNAALDALADEVHVGKISEVSVPMFRNYGMVLADLAPVLENRKSPIDSELDIHTTKDGIEGTIKFLHR